MLIAIGAIGPCPFLWVLWVIPRRDLPIAAGRIATTGVYPTTVAAPTVVLIVRLPFPLSRIACAASVTPSGAGGRVQGPEVTGGCVTGSATAMDDPQVVTAGIEVNGHGEVTPAPGSCPVMLRAPPWMME